MMHISTCLSPKREIIPAVFFFSSPSNTFTRLANAAIREDVKKKKTEKKTKKTVCLLNAIIFTSRKTCQNIFPRKPALFVKFSAD